MNKYKLTKEVTTRALSFSGGIFLADAIFMFVKAGDIRSGILFSCLSAMVVLFSVAQAFYKDE